MKLKKDFVVYEIDGDRILVCLDSRKFSGVIKLNSTAAFIAERMTEETTKDALVAAILEKYSEVDAEGAAKAVDSLVDSLASIGAAEA